MEKEDCSNVDELLYKPEPIGKLLAEIRLVWCCEEGECLIWKTGRFH